LSPLIVSIVRDRTTTYPGLPNVFDRHVRIPVDEPPPPPPPTPEEPEREMEYFVELEEAFTRDEIE
jgi:hypothetical protein